MWSGVSGVECHWESDEQCFLSGSTDTTAECQTAVKAEFPENKDDI